MAIDGTAAPGPDDPAWRPLVERAGIRADAVERFEPADADPVTHLRLDLHPDGAVARFRAVGSVVAEAGAEEPGPAGPDEA